jgi:hypothetical protein
VASQIRRAGRAWCLGAVALCVMGGTSCFSNPRPGKLREQWERSNGTVQIRGEVYDEGDTAHRLAIFDERHCHLSLRSLPPGSDTWREIGSAYFAPCDADIKSRVRFVNDRVAFFFFQWWYTVTVNGGESWHFWDVAAHLPGRAYTSTGLIEDVSIKPDGTGTMTLNPVGLVEHKQLPLHTADFGQNWMPEETAR